MNRQVKYLFLIVVIGTLTFSCTNKELESRVAELEGKVAALEGTKKPTPVTKPTPVKEPETKPDGPLPTIEFTEELHDFGKINEGDVVEHTFVFKNTGEAPLIISNARASCGCTVPQWPKEPIAVGEEGEIKVRFNSNKKPGMQNKTVTVTANTWPTRNTVRIKADVKKKEDPA